MTSEEPLLIRTDADSRNGSGHLIRSIALAHAWAERRGPVHLASTHIPDQLLPQVKRANIQTHSIAAEAESEADASLTAQLARKLDVRAVHLDSYRFSPSFQFGVKNALASNQSLSVCDDYVHWPSYHADVLLDQSMSSRPADYRGRIANTHLLIGPQYAMLRPEYWTPDPPTPRMDEGLIALGGNPDLNQLQSSAKRILASCDDLRLLHIIGAPNSLLQFEDPRVKVWPYMDDITPILKRIGWGIIAGGITTWELLRFGIPFAVLGLTENQEPNRKALIQRGLAMDTTFEMVGQVAQDLMEDESFARRIRSEGPQVIDGQGACRVVSEMLQDTSAPEEKS